MPTKPMIINVDRGEPLQIAYTPTYRYLGYLIDSTMLPSTLIPDVSHVWGRYDYILNREDVPIALKTKIINTYIFPRVLNNAAVYGFLIQNDPLLAPIVKARLCSRFKQKLSFISSNMKKNAHLAVHSCTDDVLYDSMGVNEPFAFMRWQSIHLLCKCIDNKRTNQWLRDELFNWSTRISIETPRLVPYFEQFNNNPIHTMINSVHSELSMANNMVLTNLTPAQHNNNQMQTTPPTFKMLSADLTHNAPAALKEVMFAHTTVAMDPTAVPLKSLNNFQHLWHNSRRTPSILLPHDYRNHLTTKNPQKKQCFNDTSLGSFCALYRQLIFDYTARRDITNNKKTSIHYYRNDCGAAIKHLKKMMSMFPTHHNEWLIYLQLLRHQINFKRLLAPLDYDTLDKCPKCSADFQDDDQNGIYHILAECPEFETDRECAWQEAMNLLRCNRALPNLMTLQDQLNHFGVLIDVNASALNAEIMNSPTYKPTYYSEKNMLDELIHRPRTHKSKRYFAALHCNTTMEEVCLNKAYLDQEGWARRKEVLSQTIPVKYHWMLTNEYVDLYNHTVHKHHKQSIINLMRSRGDLAALRLADDSHIRTSDVIILYPDAGAICNTITSLYLMYIIRSIMHPNNW